MYSNKPLFSIITICFNEENRIRKTLESVYSQTYKNFEHIIEDGMSHDGTLAIIEKESGNYLRRQLKLFSEKDNGLYDAMNRAIARASGEYLCFINSGDYLYDENTLQKVAMGIEEYPGMDWYYGDCIVIFANGDEYFQIPTTIENVEGRDMKDYLKVNPLSLNHQSIFAHRSCFEENIFDTDLKLRAEVKWYYQCLLRNKKIKRLLFPVCKYAYGGLSERAESLQLHIREMQDILEGFGLLTEENLAGLPKEGDYAICYKNIYNTWLAAFRSGHSIERYLVSNGIKSVAIYGYAELGAHLVNELKGTEIEINCLIDRQRREDYSGIRVIRPEEFNSKVDMIIVTAIVHFNEVKDYMKRITNCRIISLEEILEDVWM